jgi:D-alanyl-D-alanine carboxypeptidase/D-alanyl-D-alanine-endopeptidase (penicillin-binding protein 4)
MPSKCRFYTGLFLGLFLNLHAPSTAWSKAQLNSMCYMEDKPEAKVQGTNASKMYEVASLSKIATSYWALANLGAKYRFKTTIQVTPVSQEIYDVHIAGGRDPFFGRELTFFLISELSRLNIRNVRTLSFDENFVFYWDVREKPIPTIKPVPEKIEANLRQRLKFNPKQYQSARAAAQSVGITMEAAPRVKISSVQFRSKQNFTMTSETKTLELRSVPLHRYIKEMNRNSNNHVADRMFEFLGGHAPFQDFIKAQLGFDAEDIHFINGSGDSISIENSEGKKVKLYNKASCDALVHILDATRGLLRSVNMDLEDVMSVSGTDSRSTLHGRYSAASLSGAMVAKTGTVDPAVALAGMISTENGDVYFGILYHTDGPGDWNRGRDLIRTQVVGLMAKYNGKESIKGYQTPTFLPFDSNSRLSKPPVETQSKLAYNEVP